MKPKPSTQEIITKLGRRLPDQRDLENLVGRRLIYSVAFHLAWLVLQLTRDSESRSKKDIRPILAIIFVAMLAIFAIHQDIRQILWMRTKRAFVRGPFRERQRERSAALAESMTQRATAIPAVVIPSPVVIVPARIQIRVDVNARNRRLLAMSRPMPVPAPAPLPATPEFKFRLLQNPVCRF